MIKSKIAKDFSRRSLMPVYNKCLRVKEKPSEYKVSKVCLDTLYQPLIWHVTLSNMNTLRKGVSQQKPNGKR